MVDLGLCGPWTALPSLDPSDSGGWPDGLHSRGIWGGDVVVCGCAWSVWIRPGLV